MPTAFVTYTPSPNTKPPANLIEGAIGPDKVQLIPIDLGDAKLNCIQAANRAGVFIPHYCYHPALTVVASCRMCLVEVGERKADGSLVVPPKVVPGCQTPVKDGTVIVTNSQRTQGAQEHVLESILLNHPLDCPVCDKAGECHLQDYSYQFGNSQTRMIDQKNTPPNKPNIGPNISLFTDRCIMCSRCVRFTREVAGTAELHIVNRGHHSEIDVFPGDPIDNKLATNVVDLCPVGALASNDFLYKHRVWNLKTVDSVCPDCSTGCSIHLDANKSIVYRLRPRENPQAQGHFMCDDGRLGYHYINSKDRLLTPMVMKDGKLAPVSYEDAIDSIRSVLTDSARKDAAGIVGIASPWLTCEEAYLFARYMKGLSKFVLLGLGPIPVVGEDDTYPKDRRGNPIQPVKFTIRAEKCPNRQGVTKILQQFQGLLVGFDAIVQMAKEGRVKTLYFAGGYPPREPAWLSAEQADALKKVPTLIVHDLHPSPLSAAASIVLPAASFAEKDGTFINHAGLAQSIKWAANPNRECRTDGQVFLDLLGRRGLLHASTIRKELANEVRGLSALAAETLGEYGIFVGSRQ